MSSLALLIRSLALLMSILACCMSIMSPPRVSASDEGYSSVAGPCDLEFPKDHSAHPGFRTEWWYYTGNLKTASNEQRYGFQLTFFRRQIRPLDDGTVSEPSTSSWRTSQIFLAHAAVSDIGSQRFLRAEDMARGVPGLAGVDHDGQATTVYLKGWSAKIMSSDHKLHAEAEDFAFDLFLTPKKRPVPHGNSGYSLKGKNPESAGCYYSVTRMEVKGTLTIEGKVFEVTGASWMDHEFSSAPLEPDLVGWDWFSLQLGNETELMIYLLRRKDGSFSSASSGTFIDASGLARHLSWGEFEIEVLDYWRSPHSGARYPAKWMLRVPSLGIELVITPGIRDQEMQTPESTRVTYWEGSISAAGSIHGKALSGEGYAELTGYASNMSVPL